MGTNHCHAKKSGSEGRSMIFLCFAAPNTWLLGCAFCAPPRGGSVDGHGAAGPRNLRGAAAVYFPRIVARIRAGHFRIWSKAASAPCFGGSDHHPKIEHFFCCARPDEHTAVLAAGRGGSCCAGALLMKNFAEPARQPVDRREFLVPSIDQHCKLAARRCGATTRSSSASAVAVKCPR